MEKNPIAGIFLLKKITTLLSCSNRSNSGKENGIQREKRMRKVFFKQAAVLALAAAMVVGTTSTALAGEWK